MQNANLCNPSCMRPDRVGLYFRHLNTAVRSFDLYVILNLKLSRENLNIDRHVISYPSMLAGITKIVPIFLYNTQSRNEL